MKKNLSFLDRFLTVWIFLAMAIGVASPLATSQPNLQIFGWSWFVGSAHPTFLVVLVGIPN